MSPGALARVGAGEGWEGGEGRGRVGDAARDAHTMHLHAWPMDDVDDAGLAGWRAGELAGVQRFGPNREQGVRYIYYVVYIYTYRMTAAATIGGHGMGMVGWVVSG